MNKSVYSIVLSDDVVAQVDRLAYKAGTSRSAMINRILADYVSYVTPEQRLRDILGKAAELVSAMDQMQVMLQPTNTHLALKSALRYKYNPTVKYSVELYKSGSALGELRVTMRTQNKGLIACLTEFFRLWAAVEQLVLGTLPECAAGEGKYTRILHLDPQEAQQATGDMVGRAIMDYVHLLDRCMKLWFEAYAEGVDPGEQIVRLYREYKHHHLLLK
ncbi:MAG: ribbon-helix-helix protein, CopG family [Clostridia bacterium]|nr:ribbon-helix-helix protein, CopG family [Clostridia bacterium]